MISSVLSNFGRYLFQAGSGSSDTRDIIGGGQMLVQLPAGELYALRSSLTGRGGHMQESIFKDATLTLLKMADDQYVLRVDRCFEEGEELLLSGNGAEDGDSDRDEEVAFVAKTLIFPLKEALNFKRESGPTGGLAFGWRSVAPQGYKSYNDNEATTASLEASFATFYSNAAADRKAKQATKGSGKVKGNELHGQKHGAIDTTSFGQDAFSRWLRPYQAAGWSFLFVPDGGVTAHTLQFFHLTLVQCLYEVETGRHYDTAEASLFEAMMAGQPLSRILKAQKIDTEGMAVFATFGPAVSFSMYNPASGLFEPQSTNSMAHILQPTSSPPSFILHIEDVASHALLYHEPIHANATQHVERAAQSFVWCQESVALSLRFEKESELFRFANAYARAVFSIVNRTSMPSEDVAYLTGAYIQDVPMKSESESSNQSDTEDESDLESDSESESESDSDASESDIPQKMSGRRSQKIHDPSDTANSLMALGYKSNRAFVTRGTSIGVFSSKDSQSALQHQTTIKQVSTLKGAAFAPDKVLLHQGDSSLLMTRPGDSTIYRMDLDRGKVVEEWQLGGIDQGSNLVAMVPDSKYAQLTDNATLVGLGSKSLFRIDPRLSGVKRVAESGKTYASAPALQCGATTGTGALAVASAKGDIRLFSAGNGIDKRAKTLLPALGDPILGVDVSESGRFLLATCARYLLFLDLGTTSDDDNASNISYGYGKAIPSTARPIPKRLQLSPEHVAYMGGPTHLSFTKAYFSTGAAEERAIVAATGPFVITWQLKDILKGHLTRYAIKQYGQTIVADQFKYGNERAIVVTLPQDVTLVDKKQLSAFVKK